MEWIGIKDQLPTSSMRVLGVDITEEKPYVDFLTFFIDKYGNPEWSSYTCNTFDPTHWMPVPDLPKES
jgi:uncharacterized protein DUF551